MKFKCRKCAYYGNNPICPECNNANTIRWKEPLEREAYIYFYEVFMKGPITAYWSTEYDKYVKDMVTLGMMKVIRRNVGKEKEHREAHKNIDHPIWMELCRMVMLGG